MTYICETVGGVESTGAVYSSPFGGDGAGGGRRRPGGRIDFFILITKSALVQKYSFLQIQVVCPGASKLFSDSK